jgi:radical SAM protein with 4Fe4S-binding SPASM domain
MRIKYQDLRNPRRTPLREAIPLDTPFLVMIDPANVCNMRCSFCPTGHRYLRDMRTNGIMDWDLFHKIVDNFTFMPHRIKQLTFCKDGEPLLNKHLVEMIRYARDADIADRIWLKTNGVLLTPEMNTKLSKCGLDLIGVSVKQFSREGYKKVTGVEVDYDKLIRMTEDLFYKCKDTDTRVYVSTINLNITDLDATKFYDDFEHKCDYIAIEDAHGWSLSQIVDFAQGSVVFDTVVTDKIACPWPLFTMGINYDGSVSACQEDWSMSNIIGNLNTETVSKIWHGQKRRDFLRTHLVGRRAELPACAQCSYIKFCPDNIDEYRKEILTNYD